MNEFREQNVIAASMPSVTIYSDGSFKPQLGTGGYGSIAVCGGFTQFFYGGFYDVSNNAMELGGALAPIRCLNRPCRVLVVSDSQYLVNGINKWVSTWHANKWRKSDGGPIQNLELWQEMYQYMQIHLISAQWRRGHTAGNFDNTIADQFACIGAYKEARRDIPPHLLDIARA